MMVDLSILKDIDFTNSDNLLFLSIFLILAIIVIAIIFFLLAEVLKLIKKLFNIETRVALKGRADASENFLQNQEDANTPKKRIPGSDFYGAVSDEKQREEPKMGAKEADDAKAKEKISEQLNKLKEDSSQDQEDASAPKMPSRGEDSQDSNEKPKIPVAKKFAQESSAVVMSSSAKQDDKTDRKQKPVGQQDKKVQLATPGKSAVMQADRMGNLRSSDIKITQQGKNIDAENGPILEKPDFMKNELGVGSAKKTAKSGGSIIFGDKNEISRSELRQKLGKDMRVWKAEKDAGLTFSASEREQIEKIFPQRMGGNISKSDLKSVIKKINEKRISAKGPAQKEVLRKGANFLKKIGGIK